jgi:superoxide oxidase
MQDDHRIHPQLVFMHWLMAVLIVVAVAAILGRAQLPAGHSWRPVMRNVHLVAGQLILGLVVLRMAVRWWHPLAPAAGVSTWATWAGRSVHVLLYGVMLAQPLTGILFMQAGGKDVLFLGWHLPRLIGENNDLHFQLKEAHQVIGTGFYVLLGMHVSAALWHHLVLRNSTLHRMLPWLPVRRARAVADADRAPAVTGAQDEPMGPAAQATTGSSRRAQAMPEATAALDPANVLSSPTVQARAPREPADADR